MMKERITIAIYFDLENIDKKLDVNLLLGNIALEIQEEKQSIFAIKLACGNTTSIANFRDQLRDSNFEIREAPHVSEKNIKNRSDLILSLEAFETLVHQKPDIDLYIFITSDTDFTVVMDKLRKYGKEVWLVTNEKIMSNRLFSSSADTILKLSDSFYKPIVKDIKMKRRVELDIIGFSKEHQEGIVQVLDSFEKDVWHNYSKFGSKINNLFKDFTYKGKPFNSQKKLFEQLRIMKKIETSKIDKNDFFKVK